MLVRNPASTVAKFVEVVNQILKENPWKVRGVCWLYTAMGNAGGGLAIGAPLGRMALVPFQPCIKSLEEYHHINQKKRTVIESQDLDNC